MPDTNGGRMLTAPETRLANRAAVSPADRMYTPVEEILSEGSQQ
jgi:hypothetical protein